MRRRAALLVLLAGPVMAQPALVAELSVDREAYAYGEPIVAAYAVRNEGTETTAIWGSSSCKIALQIGALVSPGPGGACTADDAPDGAVIEPGQTVTWVWRLAPAALGIPEADGTQTVTGFVQGTCGPTADRLSPCELRAEATFEAPRYLGGTVEVRYAVADADSAEAVLEGYNGRHVFSEGCCGEVSAYWEVEGTALDEVVAALEANGVILEASAYRLLYPADRFVTATAARPGPAWLAAPVPNPTASASAVTLRLGQAAAVVVDVVDALGRRVAVLHEGPLAGGVEHAFMVDGGALPAGVYVVRVVGEGVRQARRLVVAR